MKCNQNVNVEKEFGLLVRTIRKDGFATRYVSKSNELKGFCVCSACLDNMKKYLERNPHVR